MRLFNASGVLLISMLFLVGPYNGHSKSATCSRTITIGDLEGQYDQIQGRIDRGDLAVSGSGAVPQLDFKDPSTCLVFLGDLPDWGPHSIKVRRQLLALQERYPDRVQLLLGNRDLNKLGFLLERYHLAAGQSRAFNDWLSKNKLRNNQVSQLRFWLQEHGGGGALEFHRQELSSLSGKSVSIEDAASDYIRSISPGGEHYKLLERGKLLHADGKTLFVHGGVNSENFLRVPGSTQNAQNIDDWARKLNDFKDKELKDIRTTLDKAKAAAKARLPVPENRLYAYGDAVWDEDIVDATTGRRGAIQFNGMSVVYPPRSKEGDKFLSIDTKTSIRLKQMGMSAVVVGHTPAGNVPQIQSDGRIMLAYADVSRSDNKKVTQVDIVNTSTNPQYALTSADDKGALSARADAGGDSMIGRTTKDGYTVVATRNNGRSYILFKYDTNEKGHRFIPTSREVSAQELRTLDPRLQTGRLYSDTDVISPQKVQSSLLAKGKKLYGVEDLDSLLQGKKPIMITSFSRYGQSPRSEAELTRMFDQILDNADLTKVAFVTGGTDKGGEGIFHRLAKARGATVVGFVPSDVVVSEVNLVDNIVVASGNGEWSKAAFQAIDQVRTRGGIVLAAGGGGVVKDAIAYAEKNQVPTFLVGGDPKFGKTVEGWTGGASAQRAAELGSSTAKTKVISDGADALNEMFRSHRDMIAPESLRQARNAMFESFVRSLPPETATSLSYDDLLAKAKGKKVVVLGGFSGLGYENPESLKTYMRALVQRNGSNAMYVIGGTGDGIGQAYRWIPDIAKELGLSGVETAGIVSRNAAEWGIEKQNYIHFVDTEVDNWEVKDKSGRSLMVDIAARTKGEMVYFGGGAISALEIEEARDRGVRATLVRDPALGPNPQKVQKTLARNPNAVIDGKQALASSGKVPIVRSVQQFSSPDSTRPYDLDPTISAPDCSGTGSIIQKLIQ